MRNHWNVVNDGTIVVSNTPETLWQNAITYFKWCDENPIISKTTVTSGKEAGKKFENEHIRPYSLKAFCLHCGVLEEYIASVKNNSDPTSLFYIVVSRIVYLIYIQNMELATVGVFNPIFTAKVLNLENERPPEEQITVNVVSGLPSLPRSENAVLENLKIERGEIINREM